MCNVCGTRSWDQTFWDTVRTSRRSLDVGSAAGFPMWIICSFSPATGFYRSKEPAHKIQVRDSEPRT